MSERGRIRNTLKLIKRLKKYRAGMVYAIFSGILHHLFTISLIGLCAYAVGLAMEGQLGGQIHQITIALAALVCLKVLMYYIEMWFAHHVAFKILSDFRNMLYDAIERVSPAILLNMRSGQLASTLMSDVEVLEWFFAHTFGSILVAAAVPAVILVFLGFLNPLLPCIMLFFMMITIGIPFLMKNKADRQGAEVREALAQANSVTVEGIHGMKEILTQDYLPQYRQKNRKHMQRLYQAQYQYGKRLGLEGGLIQGAVGFASLGVMAASVWLIFQGEMDFKWFPVVITLAGGVFAPILEISNTARNFGLIFASANRIFLVLEAKAPVEDAGKDMETEALEPSILFSDVSFAYGENLANAVSHVSFTVQPGETAALVGHSGAGKSTCVNLLLRYWDTKQGAVKIGGVNIKDMSLESARKMISAVLQETYLFNISIRENIRLGKPEASDEEVEEAARTALAHDFICSLPKGYDTVSGERGVMLSGGQRQRIAIARALLKNAPILVLDEAVSNLDTENEYEIQKALRQSFAGRTTLVVAHRLSTIMSADKLIVLQEGKVVQTGTHEDLIRCEGPYKQLVRAQFPKESAVIQSSNLA